MLIFPSIRLYVGYSHCSGQTCYSDKGKRTRNKITGNQFFKMVFLNSTREYTVTVSGCSVLSRTLLSQLFHFPFLHSVSSADFFYLSLDPCSTLTFVSAKLSISFLLYFTTKLLRRIMFASALPSHCLFNPTVSSSIEIAEWNFEGRCSLPDSVQVFLSIERELVSGSPRNAKISRCSNPF